MHRLPILDDSGREVSYLAVRFDAPPEGGPAPFCFLYLHGFGSDQWGEKAEYFRAQALANGFPFCSLDFQGHGRSGGSLRDLTLTRNLQDVARVQGYLRERGHERLCLIGSSMGGGTGLWYSALHPEDVVAGLHIAPALELEDSLLAWAGPERTRAWEETGAIRFQNDFVACDLGWCLIEDLRAHLLEDLRRRYRTPALLLQGKLDADVPWRGVAEFATHCAGRDVDLHLFADGDHRLTDRKDRLWSLMLEFLTGRNLVQRDGR
ncbi:MAG TPA: alpha/beta fold hydrolase [Thermoanaerobaculia bacterium]